MACAYLQHEDSIVDFFHIVHCKIYEFRKYILRKQKDVEINEVLCNY
jgi:hypothetical protein